MKKNKIAMLSLLLSCSTTFALIAGPARITGTIKSFDDKVVVVENDKSKYEIPKNFVNEKDLKADKKVEILLSQEQSDQVKIQKKKSK
jgi:hypothetical protein